MTIDKSRARHRVTKAAHFPKLAGALTARPAPGLASTESTVTPPDSRGPFVCYADATRTVLATNAREVTGTNYAKNQKGMLYRGDRRSPDIILKEGFQPRGYNKNLREHLGLGDDSFFVSATTDYDVAVKYALLSGEEQSYVYSISPMHLPDGCWIPGIFPDRAAAANKEFAIPGPVSPESITDVHAVTPKDLERHKNETSRWSKAKQTLVDAVKKFKLDSSTSAKLKLEDGKLKADIQAPHLRLEGALPLGDKEQDKNRAGSWREGNTQPGYTSDDRSWGSPSRNSGHDRQGPANTKATLDSSDEYPPSDWVPAKSYAPPEEEPDVPDASKTAESTEPQDPKEILSKENPEPAQEELQPEDRLDLEIPFLLQSNVTDPGDNQEDPAKADGDNQGDPGNVDGDNQEDPANADGDNQEDTGNADGDGGIDWIGEIVADRNETVKVSADKPCNASIATHAPEGQKAGMRHRA